MSAYNIAGATLSEKNAKEEYLLSSSQLSKGIDDGKLNVQWRSFHGNTYRLFIRSEVAAFARTVEPDPDLLAVRNASMVKQNLITKRLRLQTVTNELSGIDSKKAALIIEKRELEQWLLTNDPKAAAQAEKDAAKEQAKLAKAAAKAEKAAAKAVKPKSAAQKKRKAEDDAY